MWTSLLPQIFLCLWKPIFRKLEINLVNMNSKPGVCVQIHITVMRKNGNKNKVCVLLDRLTIYDGSSAAEELLLSKSKFKVETFLPILDTNLWNNKMCTSYSQIGILFSFFSELKTIASDALKKNCEHLANMYHKDLNYNDLLNECEHLKHYMALNENCETLPALYRK